MNHALLIPAVLATGCIIDPNDLPETGDAGPPPQCLAIPVCDAGWVEVESCPADAECRELTLCGATVACIPEPIDNCEAFPSCDAGDEPSETLCEDEEAGCYEREICGYRIACREAVACLTVVAECAPDEDQSDIPCRPDEDCHAVGDGCSPDVFCRPIEQCDAFPSCNPWEVGGDEACRAGEWNCRAEYLCGSWVFCREDDGCGDGAGFEAPPEGDEAPGAPRCP